VLLLVSLTGERAIYLALELDRSWTELSGQGIEAPSEKRVAARDDLTTRRLYGVDQVYSI
jgi:hypothetical protein